MTFGNRVIRALADSPVLLGGLASALVTLAVLGLSIAGALERVELGVWDLWVSFQPARSIVDPRILLVDIKDDDMRAHGYPITDAAIARALEAIARRGPRAIGLDLFRDVPVPPAGPDADGLPPGRARFDAVLRAHPNIIVAAKLPDAQSRGVAPPSSLLGSERVGFVDILPDPGGIVRRGLLFLSDEQGQQHVAFGLHLALLYLAAEGRSLAADPRNPENVRLGAKTIRPLGPNYGGYIRADAAGYQLLLDFEGGAGSFATVSFSDVLKGRVGDAAIKDRVVVIGVNAQSVKDFFYTPHSRRLLASQHIPGSVIHAHVVSQLIRMGLDGVAPFRAPFEQIEWLWIAVWAGLGTAVGLRVRSAWRFALIAVIGVALLAAVAYVGFMARWWIPVVPAALAWLAAATIVVAYASSAEREERMLLMQLFSRHVSRQVAETIWRDREQFLDGARPRPQRLIATVLFTDLVGFTATAEKQSPEEVVDWLNEYMEVMARRILERGGLINKYIGDSIMAIFGVPVARESEAEIQRDAAQAVDAALAMRQGLAGLNEKWREGGFPPVAMRIGIQTGPLVAGSVGSTERLEYTVIGDTVNVASRLEGFAKEEFSAVLDVSPDEDDRCRILAGASTVELLGDEFDIRAVGKMPVKGKEQPVEIYRILGRARER